ncbi:hypothetical protein [Sphaerisporangium album]|uniref:hypothetical protein n=1 Tax=Sphaerisporangium album TaxID=509200 RepID=UPI0015F0BAF0|nr:hypothetical protein [Sphaerisporangium album]
MLGVVPAERRDALVAVHAERAQGAGQAGGLPGRLAVRQAPVASPVFVATSWSANRPVPYRMIEVTVSGNSGIVLRISATCAYRV